MTTSTFRELERGGVGLIAWTSERFPAETVAVVTTRRGGVSRGPFASLNLALRGADEPRAVAENHRRLREAVGIEAPLFCARQVHGPRVLSVDEGEGEEGPAGVRVAGSGDGLLTRRAGRFLMTFHADCLPIFLLDPRARVAVLLHAGWRGTLAGIATAGVRAAVAAGAEPARILAGIGPGAGPCCYEIDEPVIRGVHDVFPDGDALLEPTRRGRARFDLWEANRRLLVAAGVPAEQVTLAGMCTRCDPDRFFSYRRAGGGATGQMAAVMGFGAAREGGTG